MVEICDHLGVLEAGNQIQQKGPMHTFHAYSTSARAQMDQYLKGYCLKEFPQVLIELLAADDSGRGSYVSTGEFTGFQWMASSPSSYRWPWINSEPQNKAKRHEHEKGLVGRKEGSLKMGKNSEVKK